MNLITNNQNGEVMKRNKKRLITALIIIVAVAAVLVFMKFFNGNLLYISTGMGKSVVMKVDGQKTYTFEAEVLMSDAKKQYEDMFGSSIWTEDIDGQPLYKRTDKSKAYKSKMYEFYG